MLAALSLGAVVAAGAVAVAPADAAPSAPAVKVVAGNRAITAAWSAVSGATTYTVRLSKKRSLSHARVITTTSRTVKLGKLKNGTQYFVDVTADGPRSVRSAVVKSAAASGVPFATKKVTVSAGPAANQVKVSWSGGGRALKVAVVAGSNVTTDVRSFHSAWYPATTRSIVLTVPAKYRSTLGAGSGNPVFVKVVQSNSSSASFGPSYSYARKYRPSPAGSWAFAKAVVASALVTRLRVAELNVQSVGATAGYSTTNRWAARAQRAADYIDEAHPDLLMTAELATNKLGSCRNHPYLGQPYACRNTTQVADLAKRLTHLKVADVDAYDRVLDQMNSSKTWNGNVTNGSHVFYDPAKLTVLDWGYISPGLAPGVHFGKVTGLGVPGWTNPAIKGDRWFTWAKLRTNSSGREFFAVAGHLPVGNAAAVVKVRYAESKLLVTVLDRLAGNLPMVLGADMNGDATRDPKPAQVSFIADGWFDAAAVPAKKLRSNMKVSTANGSGKQIGAKDPGYGSKPVRHPYETSRIDYILLRNSPHTFGYANVLHLHRNGTFIKSLQGTDHNMQLATIGIGDPVG
ncbi:hypothetical protein [Amnibacterium soli]|uniref:hypothetical protein n=1 Tax=Amnibacterium soli TaxID=1282736 RepID=UPI0031E8EB8D